jgi:hypothetical protein
VGRLRDLLLSLFEQRKDFIESFSEKDCSGWTATQVRRDHDVDFDALAFRQKRVCRQLDLNRAIVNAECRSAIEVNKGCEIGASRGYSNPWSLGDWVPSGMMVPVGVGGGRQRKRCWLEV